MYSSSPASKVLTVLLLLHPPCLLRLPRLPRLPRLLRLLRLLLLLYPQLLRLLRLLQHAQLKLKLGSQRIQLQRFFEPKRFL